MWSSPLRTWDGRSVSEDSPAGWALWQKLSERKDNLAGVQGRGW